VLTAYVGDVVEKLGVDRPQPAARPPTSRPVARKTLEQTLDEAYPFVLGVSRDRNGQPAKCRPWSVPLPLTRPRRGRLRQAENHQKLPLRAQDRLRPPHAQCLAGVFSAPGQAAGDAAFACRRPGLS
jgi:hypothetical protein